MNDNELLTIVRESVAHVRTQTSVTQIIRRGHAIRARRRAPVAAAAAVAVAGGSALAATTLAAEGHPRPLGSDGAQTDAGRSPTAQATKLKLAAWTVTKQADGTVSITLRQLQDPTGLQATLRADDVPATVTFQHLNDSCQAYPASPTLLDRVFPSNRELPTPPAGTPHMTRATAAVPPPSPSVTTPGAGSVVVDIDPTALPNNAGVQLASSTSAGSVAILLPRLVYATSACTG